MVEIDIRYLGQLRCEATHGPSGTKLITDAPVDNMGKGESFSPTDLVATGLGVCMMTLMGIMRSGTIWTSLAAPSKSARKWLPLPHDGLER